MGRLKLLKIWVGDVGRRLEKVGKGGYPFGNARRKKKTESDTATLRGTTEGESAGKSQKRFTLERNRDEKRAERIPLWFLASAGGLLRQKNQPQNRT